MVNFSSMPGFLRPTITAPLAAFCKKLKTKEATCCSISMCRARSILIMPPKRSELERRPRERSQDSAEVIQRRLETARREIENYEKYDYILVNDRLSDSVKALEAILLSERQKRSGQRDSELLARAEICRLDQSRERLQPILQS